LTESPQRWGDLARRVRTALVLLPIALFCVWAGGLAFWLLVAVACLLLVHEWVTMCGFGPLHGFGFWMMAIIVAASICGETGVPLMGVSLVLAGAAIAAFRDRFAAGRARNDTRRDRFNLALGFPYLGLAAVAIPWLRADPDAGSPNLMFVLSLVWASDIGAYVVGRWIGGEKLAPAISPGKTWSGAIGGLACAALTGLLVASLLSTGYSPSHVVGLAIILGLISQAGDLLESALKRRFGVKDSGSIIPGHGGLLDRLDALIVVAPVAALLAFTAGPGVVLWR
jgi:phosphatidate cytidylyltransferase